MRFYTNVQLIGNQFLVRGVDNGRRFEIRDKEFSPTLFVKSKVDTKYKTLNGDSVDAIQPGSCLLYTSPSPRDLSTSRMPSSA